MVKLVFSKQNEGDFTYVYKYSGTVFHVGEVISFTKEMRGHFYWQVVEITHIAEGVDNSDEMIQETDKLIILKPFKF